jgi:cell division septation protein DedD
MGRHDLAVAAYQKGLAVSPGSVALRNNLGLSLALRGRYAEALARLRPLGEGPEASRRTRQNLALVYGLQGDLSAAHRIGRIDLSEDELRDNLAYIASVRALRDPKLKAGAIAPLATAGRVEPVRLAAAEPAGLVELTRAMARPAPARAPAATTRRQPRPLAPTASAPPRPTPLGVIEPEAAPSSESWFVDLGRFADDGAALARWQTLQREHRQTFGGLSKLAGAGGSPEPLLVGPLPSEKAAKSVCAKMPDDLSACTAVQL